MHAFSVRARNSTLLSCLLLPIVLAASGCQRLAPPPPPCPCTSGVDITIKVNHATHPQHGVNKKAVYLGEGNKVTWQAESNNINKFEVQFVGIDLPFGAGNTIFDSDSNLSVTTPALPHFDELTVFKYTIKITDTNGVDHTFDPQVIGGGR